MQQHITKLAYASLIFIFLKQVKFVVRAHEEVRVGREDRLICHLHFSDPRTCIYVASLQESQVLKLSAIHHKHRVSLGAIIGNFRV